MTGGRGQALTVAVVAVVLALVAVNVGLDYAFLTSSLPGWPKLLILGSR